MYIRIRKSIVTFGASKLSVLAAQFHSWGGNWKGWQIESQFQTGGKFV